MTVLTCFLSSVRFSWIRRSGGLQHGARINTEAWTYTNSQPAGSVAAPGSNPGAWHLATTDESICNTPRTPHSNPYPRPTHLHSALRHIRSQVWHVSITHFAKSSKFKIVNFLQIQIRTSFFTCLTSKQSSDLFCPHIFIKSLFIIWMDYLFLVQ